jgi:TRAP-type C4-dicarboxylate transport system permease small subunit
VVRENEEIRFDILYATVSERMRRLLVIVCALAVIVLFSISLPAVLDYIGFMKVQRTAYMKIRFDVLYSIYGLFAVAMIARQLWLGVQAIRGRSVPEVDPTRITSGI